MNLPAPEKRVCQWEPDDDIEAPGWWAASCDNLSFIGDGHGPADKDWKFCPFCGGEIEEVK